MAAGLPASAAPPCPSRPLSPDMSLCFFVKQPHTSSAETTGIFSLKAEESPRIDLRKPLSVPPSRFSNTANATLALFLLPIYISSPCMHVAYTPLCASTQVLCGTQCKCSKSSNLDVGLKVDDAWRCRFACSLISRLRRRRNRAQAQASSCLFVACVDFPSAPCSLIALLVILTSPEARGSLVGVQPMGATCSPVARVIGFYRRPGTSLRRSFISWRRPGDAACWTATALLAFAAHPAGEAKHRAGRLHKRFSLLRSLRRPAVRAPRGAPLGSPL